MSGDWRHVTLPDGRSVTFLGAALGDLRGGCVEVIVTYVVDDGTQQASVWLRPGDDDGWVTADAPEPTP